MQSTFGFGKNTRDDDQLDVSERRDQDTVSTIVSTGKNVQLTNNIVDNIPVATVVSSTDATVNNTAATAVSAAATSTEVATSQTESNIQTSTLVTPDTSPELPSTAIITTAEIHNAET